MKIKDLMNRKIETFTMFRPEVPDETHDANQKNAPEEPQFEGVIFSDGTTVIHWLTAATSTSVFDSFEDLLKIHGHSEYKSYMIWDDGTKTKV